jgi:hypothetical protein
LQSRVSARQWSPVRNVFACSCTMGRGEGGWFPSPPQRAQLTLPTRLPQPESGWGFQVLFRLRKSNPTFASSAKVGFVFLLVHCKTTSAVLPGVPPAVCRSTGTLPAPLLARDADGRSCEHLATDTKPVTKSSQRVLYRAVRQLSGKVIGRVIWQNSLFTVELQAVALGSDAPWCLG